MSFETDFRWQAQFIPAIKQIVGPLLLATASYEQDAKEATDLVVLRADGLRIGCRVRRPGYDKRYPWDFTIRYHRETGSETELAKIQDGWCDWLFYGHAPTLHRWFVVNLDSFRHHLAFNLWPIKYEDKPNGDGTWLRAYNVTSFPDKPPITIASSHDWRKEDAHGNYLLALHHMAHR